MTNPNEIDLDLNAFYQNYGDFDPVFPTWDLEDIEAEAEAAEKAKRIKNQENKKEKRKRLQVPITNDPRSLDGSRKQKPTK